MKMSEQSRASIVSALKTITCFNSLGSENSPLPVYIRRR